MFNLIENMTIIQQYTYIIDMAMKIQSFYFSGLLLLQQCSISVLYFVKEFVVSASKKGMPSNKK